MSIAVGTANRIRTDVAALRTQCPRPLDDSGVVINQLNYSILSLEIFKNFEGFFDVFLLKNQG